MSALAHITGSVVFWLILDAFEMMFQDWVGQYLKKCRLRNWALDIGVSCEQLTQDNSLNAAVNKYLQKTYASDVVSNKFSDFAAFVVSALYYLSLFVSAVYLCWVVGLIIFDGGKSAPLAWISLIFKLLFFIASVIFSFMCMLMTGRYPGEASAIRQSLMTP